MPVPRERFPRSVYGRGAEPDPRFSLANERTFLAWIRTSLALVAAGVGLQAAPLLISAGFRFTAAVVFVVLGLLAAAQAWTGWARTERALREGRALPAPSLSVVLSTGVAVAVLIAGVGFLHW